MKSEKLTVCLKDRIISAAVKKTCAKPQADLASKETEFADRLVRDYIGEHRAAMGTFPRGYFIECDAVKVTNTVISKVFNLSKSVTQPASICHYYSGRLHITKPEDLAEFEKLIEQRNLLDKNRNTLTSTLRRVLNSYSTTAKLLADHPYFEEYLPKPSEPVKSLPAIRAEEVTKLIACVADSSALCKGVAS